MNIKSISSLLPDEIIDLACQPPPYLSLSIFRPECRAIRPCQLATHSPQFFRSNSASFRASRRSVRLADRMTRSLRAVVAAAASSVSPGMPSDRLPISLSRSEQTETIGRAVSRGLVEAGVSVRRSGEMERRAPGNEPRPPI